MKYIETILSITASVTILVVVGYGYHVYKEITATYEDISKKVLQIPLLNPDAEDITPTWKQREQGDWLRGTTTPYIDVEAKKQQFSTLEVSLVVVCLPTSIEFQLRLSREYDYLGDRLWARLDYLFSNEGRGNTVAYASGNFLTIQEEITPNWLMNMYESDELVLELGLPRDKAGDSAGQYKFDLKSFNAEYEQFIKNCSVEDKAYRDFINKVGSDNLN